MLPSTTKRFGSTTRFAPRFDALEDRSCPAVVFTLDATGTILTLTGDAQPNQVVIKQNDITNDLEVFGDGVTNHYASSKIQKIIVNLKESRDLLEYRLKGGSDFKFGKTVETDLGKGNDQAAYNLADNGMGALAKVLANLTIGTQAREGDDRVDLKLAQVTDAVVNVKTDLGAGADKAMTSMLADLTGKGHVRLAIEGGAGKDGLELNALADVDVAKDAVFDATLNGGTDDDVTAYHYRGELDGLLRMRADGGSGNDTDRLGTRLDVGSEGYFDALARGGDGNDVINWTHLNLAPATVHVVLALLDGGLGVDGGAASPGIVVINVP